MAAGFRRLESSRGRQIRPTPKMEDLLQMERELNEVIKETELSISLSETALKQTYERIQKQNEQTAARERAAVQQMPVSTILTQEMMHRVSPAPPTTRAATFAQQTIAAQHTMPVEDHTMPAYSKPLSQTMPVTCEAQVYGPIPTVHQLSIDQYGQGCNELGFGHTFVPRHQYTPAVSGHTMTPSENQITSTPAAGLQQYSMPSGIHASVPPTFQRFADTQKMTAPSEQSTRQHNLADPASYTYPASGQGQGQYGHTLQEHMSPGSGYHLPLPRPGAVNAQQFQTPNLTGETQTNLLERLADLLSNKQDRLPKMEPGVFSGDMLQFPTWWKEFQTLIEGKTDVVGERLFYLGKYTLGDARACIQGYLTLYTDEAYERAKATLLSRYGDKVKVAKAYKNKLDNWPVIKAYDTDGLRKYSDFLWQCNTAMGTISYLSSLDSAEENQRLVRKLPQYAASRWGRLVDKFLYDSAEAQHGQPAQPTGSYPKFADFCTFVANEARIACGPCNTRPPLESRSQKSERSGLSGAKAKSMSTQAKNASSSQNTKGTPQCIFCNAAHMIFTCVAFLGQDAETKKTFALKHGLCFGCLRRNHLYRDCRCRNPSLLQEGHKQTDPKEKQTDQRKAEEQPKSKTSNKEASATTHKISTSAQEGVLSSMILPVMLSHKDNPDQQILTYALLDNMSDSCFVKADLINELQAESTTVELEVTTLVEKKVAKTEVVQGLSIRGLKEATEVQLPKTYCQEDIPTDRGLIPRPEMVRNWSHLQDVAERLHPYQHDLDIGILSGANCSAALMPKEIIAAGDNDPYAMKTCLGWGVIGWITPSDVDQGHSSRFVYKTSTREITSNEIKRMFEQDFNENARDEKMSFEDRRFMGIVENGIHQRPGGHFEMPLPLKKDVQLPNNRALARKRLNQLKRKLSKNDEYKQEYVACMTDVIRKGYAEPVPPSELQGKTGQVWYIPHHGVHHPKKKKLRVVYDCSAEYVGQVLNRCLLQGPDLINSLVGILCRFREKPIAVSCDIEGMYHQVGVNKEHRAQEIYSDSCGGKKVTSVQNRRNTE